MAVLEDFFSEYGNLPPAEERLLQATVAGEAASIGEERPNESGGGDENRVRAAFIRYLALGGCAACAPHPRGVHLRGAWIDGALDLEGCVVEIPLAFIRCHFTSPVHLTNAATRVLNFSGSRIAHATRAGYSFAAARLRADGGVALADGFQSAGTVLLHGATISGELACHGGRFDARAPFAAILADSLSVSDVASFSTGFRANSLVRMAGARLGRLDCDGGRFDNDGGVALSIDGAQIDDYVYLKEGFHASGEVRLVGARIGGDFACDRGRFDNVTGAALTADRVSVAGSALLRSGFHARGAVRLLGARIDADLDLDGARFQNKEGVALNLSSARIGGRLTMRVPPHTDEADAGMFDGQLILQDARARTLIDSEQCWPARGWLVLAGFEYDNLHNAPTGWRRRLDWLRRQYPPHLTNDFRAQPWTRLAGVLAAQGKTLDARRILAAQKRAMSHLLPRWLSPFHRLHGAVAGYGYFPWRVVGVGLAAALVGALVFFWAWRDGAMAPAQSAFLNAAEWRACAESAANPATCWTGSTPGADAPRFNAGLYALDTFVPFVDLAQEATWAPSPARGSDLGGAPLGAWISAYRVLHEIVGYLLTGFLLAGAARLLRERL